MSHITIQRHLVSVRAALRSVRDPVARGRLRALERRLMAKIAEAGL